MSKADRDIDGALGQRFGDDSPKVGDWEPSEDDGRDGCGGFLALAFVALVIAAIVGGMMG